MKKYRLAVCKGPDCRRNGSEAVFTAAKAAVERLGLTSRCAVARGGCYGLCELGPNVVVREDVGRPKDPLSPEDFQLMGWDGEVHYRAMTASAVERVIAEHVGQDRPVTELSEPAAPPAPAAHDDAGQQ